jgi:hypothetical protein
MTTDATKPPSSSLARNFVSGCDVFLETANENLTQKSPSTPIEGLKQFVHDCILKHLPPSWEGVEIADLRKNLTLLTQNKTRKGRDISELAQEILSALPKAPDSAKETASPKKAKAPPEIVPLSTEEFFNQCGPFILHATHVTKKTKANKARSCNTIATSLLERAPRDWKDIPAEKLETLRTELTEICHQKPSPSIAEKAKQLLEILPPPLEEEEEEEPPKEPEKPTPPPEPPEAHKPPTPPVTPKTPEEQKESLTELLDSASEFIRILRNTTVAGDEKLAHAKEFLDSLNLITVKSKPQDSYKIATLMARLDLITIDAEIKKILLQIKPKLESLLPLDSKKAPPILSHFPLITSPKGIANQGNDCFLIALCQLLRVKSLTENLIKRLPKELWQVFLVNNPNAKVIRKALVDHSPLGTFAKQDKKNPMTSQLDATEVLSSLFSRIDEPDKPLPPSSLPQELEIPPTIKELSPKELYQKAYQEAPHWYTKVQLFITFWITTLFETIKDKCSSFFFNLFGLTKHHITDDTLSAPHLHHIPDTQGLTLPDPADKPKKGTPNPLNIVVKQTIHYTPQPNMPDDLKHHDHFGGLTNSSEVFSEEPYLNLPMKSNGEDHYTLLECLKAYLTASLEDHASTLTVNQVTYKAARQEKRTFSQIPQSLFLSFKRFDGNKKITKPIEGINLNITLPETLCETPGDSAQRTYALQGFLTHLGSSPNSGHYIAYRKEADGWYYFNDAVSSKVTEQQVLAAAKDAYLVFYEKQA